MHSEESSSSSLAVEPTLKDRLRFFENPWNTISNFQVQMTTSMLVTSRYRWLYVGDNFRVLVTDDYAKR